MVDRPSRPHRSPRRTHLKIERKILHLRRSKGLGQATIAGRLGMHPSTVHNVLVRHGIPKLACVDLATGQRSVSHRPAATNTPPRRPGAR
jgi:hypothetical protein